ncbi:MAG: DUF2271 domain-containing protein [Pseudoxanthomonas sp.]
MKRGCKAALWLLAACASSACATEPQRHQRENVLGTSFEMIVVDADASRAGLAVIAALDEIERLEALLSTWDDDSELSRFNRAAAPLAGSDELREVLSRCEQWREQTHGIFSCRLGSVAQIWREAETSGVGVAPDRVGLRKRARALAGIEFDAAAAQLQVAPGLQWQVDGLAKGYIIDHALRAARQAAPQATGIKLDIGGDALYWGVPAAGQSWKVALADPRATRDNAGFLATLNLHSQAIASSGHRERGFRIGRRHYSHLLDASEGWPAEYAPSATVVANDAATADALATALSVMPISEGLALVETLSGVEALIVGDRGVPFASTGWHALLADDTHAETSTGSRTQWGLDYEIPLQTGERYRQPYLAIWISSAAGEPVRQLLVLGDRSRWLRELPQWWRRYGRDDEAAVHGIARPTRQPGHYTLAWDGRDDAGRMSAAGRYVLQVEAAREHGGHELVSLPFTLDGQRMVREPQPRGEIGRIVLSPSVLANSPE